MPRKKNPVPLMTCNAHGPYVQVGFTTSECPICDKLAELFIKADAWDRHVHDIEVMLKGKPAEGRPAPKRVRKKKPLPATISDAPSISSPQGKWCHNCNATVQTKMKKDIEVCTVCEEPIP